MGMPSGIFEGNPLTCTSRAQMKAQPGPARQRIANHGLHELLGS